MMYPGVWTTMALEEDLPGALRYLHGCGWRHFELSDEHLRWIQANNAVDAALRILDELGVTIPQAHAHIRANVASRPEDVDILLDDLDICAHVGVKNVVVHPGNGGGHTNDDQRRVIVAANVEAFKRLGDRAGELGLRIGIENVSDRLAPDGLHFLGSTPNDLLELIDAVGLPSVGVTLDTSHANMQGVDIPAAVRAFGDRLYCTHISDNDGTGDHHLTPGVGRGRIIDWPAVMRAFADIGYDGIFNLEIPGARARDVRLLDLNTRHALAVTEALSAM